jgi:hypothetical protein
MALRKTVPKDKTPTGEECLKMLHKAGWSIGEVRCGSRWLVSGTNGKQVLQVEGASQDQAWYEAVKLAEDR